MRSKAEALGAKKIVLLTATLLMIVVLSGCGKKEDVSQENKSSSEKMSQEDSGNNSEKGSDGIISSIKDALSSDKAMECTFNSSEEGINAQVKSYVQGKKYKTEFMMEGKKNNSVFDGKVSYSWEEGSDQGIKIDTECLDSLSEGSDMEDFKEDSDIGEEDEFSQEDEMEVFDGAQNIKCHEVGSVDFSVPQGINFFDQCEMLKKQQQLINDLDGQIPVGMPQF